MEISRAAKFFIDQGATLTAELTSDHYRRSPLIQGGMEIPSKITAKISGTDINLLLMEKFIQFVKELYTEPKDKEILGSYLHAEATGVDLPVPLPRNAPVPKRRKSYLMYKWKTLEIFKIEIKLKEATKIIHQARVLREKNL